jgi:L-amino acid N-acyltransferase YncA
VVSKNVIIRTVEEKDVAPILEIYSPFVLKSATSFEVALPSEVEMWERVLGIKRDYPYIVCEIGKTTIGYAYVSNHRQREAYKWSKEISVYVHSDFRGKQIASALYSALFSVVKIQGITNLLAGITVPNPTSIQFHEKMGFRKLGEYKAVGYKLGKWHNVGWWELNLNPDLLQPNERIIPYSEIAFSDEVNKIFASAEKMVIVEK